MLCRLQSTKVDLVIIDAGKATCYKVPRDLLSDVSAYFVCRLFENILEVEQRRIDFRDIDPATFHAFVTWLFNHYRRTYNISEPPTSNSFSINSHEMFRLKAADIVPCSWWMHPERLWFLADRLDILILKNLAMTILLCKTPTPEFLRSSTTGSGWSDQTVEAVCQLIQMVPSVFENTPGDCSIQRYFVDLIRSLSATAGATPELIGREINTAIDACPKFAQALARNYILSATGGDAARRPECPTLQQQEYMEEIIEVHGINENEDSEQSYDEEG